LRPTLLGEHLRLPQRQRNVTRSRECPCQRRLSRIVCVDKTTLIGVLDRLEQRGLIVRTVSPSDRRVRIPQITDIGRHVYAQFAAARDSAEGRALRGVDSEQRELLLTLLARIADRGAGD